MKAILALDLALKTGWAYQPENGSISGTADFDYRRDAADSGGAFLACHSWLTGFLESYPIDTVVFESPINPRRADKAQRLLVGFAAVVELFAKQRGIRCFEVSPRTVKFFATNNGSASKDAMIAAARKLGFDPDDDNEADAIHLLRYTIHMRDKHVEIPLFAS